MSAVPSSFDFDNLELVEIPVRYQGEEMILREASADSVRKFTNKRLKLARVNEEGGVVSIGALGDLECYLLSMCLFYKATEPGGRERPVPEEEIRKWPYRMQSQLFETAKEISGLGVDDVETLMKQREIIDRKLKALGSDGTNPTSE